MIIYTESAKKQALELSTALNEKSILVTSYNSEIDDRMILVSKLDNKKIDKDLVNFINCYDNYETSFIANIIVTNKSFHYGHFYIEKLLIKNSFCLSQANNLTSTNLDKVINDLKEEKFILDKHHFLYSLTYKILG